LIVQTTNQSERPLAQPPFGDRSFEEKNEHSSLQHPSTRPGLCQVRAGPLAQKTIIRLDNDAAAVETLFAGPHGPASPGGFP
jgi:hypothetical protein